MRISLILSGSTLKLQMLPDAPTASCILSHPINTYLFVFGTLQDMKGALESLADHMESRYRKSASPALSIQKEEIRA